MEEREERLGEDMTREIMKMRIGEERIIDGVKISIEKITSQEIAWNQI